MKNKKQGQLVPYEMVTPGFEAVYATDKDLASFETTEGAKGGYLQIISEESGKKVKLPYWMGSMDKVKYNDNKEFDRWMKTKRRNGINTRVNNLKVVKQYCTLAGDKEVIKQNQGATVRTVVEVKRIVSLV